MSRCQIWENYHYEYYSRLHLALQADDEQQAASTEVTCDKDGKPDSEPPDTGNGSDGIPVTKEADGPCTDPFEATPDEKKPSETSQSSHRAADGEESDKHVPEGGSNEQVAGAWALRHRKRYLLETSSDAESCYIPSPTSSLSQSAPSHITLSGSTDNSDVPGTSGCKTPPSPVSGYKTPPRSVSGYKAPSGSVSGYKTPPSSGHGEWQHGSACTDEQRSSPSWGSSSASFNETSSEEAASSGISTGYRYSESLKSAPQNWDSLSGSPDLPWPATELEQLNQFRFCSDPPPPVQAWHERSCFSQLLTTGVCICVAKQPIVA